MGGGILQLVAFGTQDMYTCGNPQITFFKGTYKRHTNFAVEAIEQTFNGTADFGKKVTCTVSRNGDLINKALVQVTLPDVALTSANSRFRWLNWIGHVLIKSVEVEIGGQRIDRHYGDWLHIWNELTQTSGHEQGYANMVGNTPKLTQLYGEDGTVVKGQTLYIPLQFWFCRNYGLSLPLIALQYHEVKINLEFRPLSECCFKTADVVVPALSSASIFIDFIYLDTDERRRFAQVSHEYLITQLQFTGDESVSNTNNKIKTSFNHPTKAIYWVCQPDENITEEKTKDYGGLQWFNYTDSVDKTAYSGTPEDSNGGGMVGGGAFDPNTLPFFASGIGGGSSASNPPFASTGLTSVSGTAGINNYFDSSKPHFDEGLNPVKSAKIQLNGHDRFSERDGRYFNLVQPYQHHTRIPSTGINMYSFAFKPEEHQPTGSINFSRIDSMVLMLTLTKNVSSKVRVYAINYNVLRIMSGMGGLGYAN